MAGESLPSHPHFAIGSRPAIPTEPQCLGEDEESVEDRPAVPDDPQHLDEDEESVEDRPAVPDEPQYLQHYAPPAYRGSKPGMMSSDLRSVVSSKVFTRDIQDQARDCDDKDAKKDSPTAAHVAHDVSKAVNTTEGVDEITEVENEEDDSDEENENLSRRVQILRN